MTRKHSTLLLTALAAAVSSALAQEAPPPVTGYVAIGGMSTHVTSQNRFRLEEYRDLESGVTGSFMLNAGSGAWWHRLFGENLGRDDQSIEVKGGRYGIFKYSVYNEDIIHNLTFGAITPFSGVGTNNLTFAGTAPPSTDTTTWNTFDYRVKHSNIGAIAEVQPGFESPFYLRVTANRKESEGIRPLGAAGTSPGGPAYELQAPIDWTTTDWSAEVGYTTRAMHVAANVLISKFEDSNNFLFWRTPTARTGATIEQSTLAPDNELKRLGVNAIFRQLPMDSSLALRGTYTKLTTDFAIAPTFLSITGTLPNGVGNTRLANPSSDTFDGEVVNKSFSAALNSNYSRGLSSKLYYNWYKRENDSHHIVFTPSGPGSGGTCDINPIVAAVPALPTCTTEFLHFTKNNVGGEVYLRLNRANKLTFGLDYSDTERERLDFEKTKETKGSIEWKSGMLDVADFRVKYQHLQRKSDFELGASTDVFNRFLYRFDLAPLKRDQVKFVVDASPVEYLDLGFEVNVKRNRYTETVLGRDRDKREEVSVSAAYGDPKRFRVNLFGDIEHTSYDSTHWVGSTATFPVTNTAGTTYLWDSKVHDRNWLVGAAFDWPVIDRLAIKGSAIIQRGDGGVDFAANSSVANAQNIVAYDDFKKRALNLRAVYSATKQLQFTLGAAYEKYTYQDIQMDGYVYNILTGVNQSFLSGAYANPNYRATIIYGTVAYRF
jgi:hypothetical protein